MKKVIGIVGWKDVGKTFFVTEIIKLLVQKDMAMNQFIYVITKVAFQKHWKKIIDIYP